MNLYDNLPLWKDKEKNLINCIVEIPMNSMVKYEFNKDLNTIEVDRFFTTPMPIPYNYGFFSQSFNEDDGDPLDAIILSQYPIQAGSIVTGHVVGILHMLDDGELDDKIIVIPKKEPFFGGIDNIDNLSSHLKDQIEFFLSYYKKLDGKNTEVQGYEGKEKAIDLIEKCEQSYKNK